MRIYTLLLLERGVETGHCLECAKCKQLVTELISKTKLELKECEDHLDDLGKNDLRNQKVFLN